jgi:hypothetical protein
VHTFLDNVFSLWAGSVLSFEQCSQTCACFLGWRRSRGTCRRGTCNAVLFAYCYIDRGWLEAYLGSKKGILLDPYQSSESDELSRSQEISLYIPFGLYLTPPMKAMRQSGGARSRICIVLSPRHAVPCNFFPKPFIRLAIQSLRTSVVVVVKMFVCPL